MTFSSLAPRAALIALLAGALFAGLAACSTPRDIPDPVADPVTMREVDQGSLVGFVTDADTGVVAGTHVWRGIPFAAAPVGDLRWRAPRPPADFEGTFEALAFGPRCPQVSNALDQGEGRDPGALVGDEDCLHLNIYAPPFDPGAVPFGDERLPVMVWIHGGGNVWGRSSDYDGAKLAADGNVIVVTVQYRLGPLGWLAHSALRETAQTADDASANFGTLDLIASLEWIRDNIGAFGGDEDNITIFGESAGGHNVASLLVSARAARLFHRAILQSGSFASMPLDQAEGTGGAPTPNPAREAVGKMLDAAGRTAGDQDTADAADIAALLRGLPLEDVYAPYRGADENSGLMTMPRVISDGVVLPDGPMENAIASPATFNAVPVMSGTNLDETRLFNALNPDLVNNYFGVIIMPKDKVFYETVSDYQSMMWRVRAVDRPFAAMASGGHTDLYAYRFDWDEQGSFLWTDLSVLLGAAHAIEIPFVFGRFGLLGPLDRIAFPASTEETRVALSDTMIAQWSSFARTGEPGGGWTPWSDGDLIVFDTPSGGGVRMESGAITTQDVLDMMRADERITDDAMLCRVFNGVAGWSAEEVEPYRATFADGLCAAEE